MQISEVVITNLVAETAVLIVSVAKRCDDVALRNVSEMVTL
jgi:hypothetical protein